MVNPTGKINIRLVKLIFLFVFFGLGFYLPIFVFAYGPTVNLKVNNSDGPITIPYRTAAILSWTSGSASECKASGDWSGSKLVYGSESTGKITSSKTYILTCFGLGGAASSDTVKITVLSASASSTSSDPVLIVKNLVRNLSKGTGFSGSVLASPGDVISFSIEITNDSTSSLENIIIKETLPGQMNFRRNSLKIDNATSGADIISGFNLGSFSPDQTKKITFETDLKGPADFPYSRTILVSDVFASDMDLFGSDSSEIVVEKKTNHNQLPPTSVSTGLTNNIFLDSFFLPLAISIAVIWVFKTHIIKFEEWFDLRKKEYYKYRTEKMLRLKIARIKTGQSLKKLLGRIS